MITNYYNNKKNDLKSVFLHPEIAYQKRNKDIAMGTVELPVSHPIFHLCEFSYIFDKYKLLEFLLIHNLSHPAQKLVNDFIDSNFSSLRYSSIDDIQRGLLNASEILDDWHRKT